jgi:hypothetical protein
MQYFYENNCTVNYFAREINGDSKVSIVAVISVVTVVTMVSVITVAIMTTAVILS